MRKSLFWGLILLIASCTVQKEKDFEDPGLHRYHAVLEEPTDAETRVFADSRLRVHWNEADHISIFERTTYNREFEFLGDTGDTAGDFEPVPSSGSGYHTGGDIEDGYVYAVYPYESRNKCDYDGKLTVTFPSVQHYKKDSFGIGANIMVAKTGTMDLRFMHVGGYRTVRLYGAGVSVSSIKIESNGPEYLSGRTDITIGQDGKPAVSFIESSSNSKSVELVCDTPVALGSTAEEYVEFWFVLPPGVLTEGFTVTITDTNGNEFTKGTANSVEIKSGVKKSMPAFEVTGGEPGIAVPEAIDLGLPSGLKWSSFNLGASSPEGYGDYYAWGETEPYYSSQDPLTWKEGKETGYSWTSYQWSMDSDHSMIKYCTNSNYGYNGFTDAKTVLDPEDDAAHVNLGGNWRMPTYEEWNELRTNCTWTWTTQNGVNGRLITASNGNSIFLPAAGSRYGIDIGDVGSRGYYWSSFIDTALPDNVWSVIFDSNGINWSVMPRIAGFSVRPVYGDSSNPVESVTLEQSNLELSIGETVTLVATVLPEDATDKSVTWSSSNPSVATVSSTGVVTGVAAGNATITVTTVDGGKTAICEVTVLASQDYYRSQYLTFEIIEGGTIVWKASDSSFERTIHYSLNGGPWTEITSTTDGVEIPVSSGDKVRFYGENSAYAGWDSATNSYQQSSFSGTARFEASGNIMSLLSPSFENLVSLTSSNSYCFKGLFLECGGLVVAGNLVLPATVLAIGCYEEMFYGCTNLTTAPELPATTLAFLCYCEMFYGCTSLTTAPELPATTLANNCYCEMFYGCTSLTSAPALPAMTLGAWCYSSMFSGCTSLTTAQEVLPATTLADRCYIGMFSGCTSLTTAPELPATSLDELCYREMFLGCTSLTTSPELPAIILTEQCYYLMFYGCTSLAAAPELPATTLDRLCYSYMFYGCTSLTTVPEVLPATTLSEQCYLAMFQNCSSLTNAPELPATSLASSCYSIMFAGCTNLTIAPELPATTLADNCFYAMFSGCSSLNYIKCLATSSGSGFTDSWLSGVSQTGTFVKNPNATWERGTSGIPTGWTVVDDTPIAVPEAIDLGLSVKWASFNVGASKPEEGGNFYAWGETEPNWENYKWCMGSAMTKYCNNTEYGYNGFTDTKTILDPDDDAAHVNLGGFWRMPTEAEWIELIENCTWTWTTHNGVKGKLVTASNGNSIFLPAAGYLEGPFNYVFGSLGLYWSASLYTDLPKLAWSVRFTSGDVLVGGSYRTEKYPVRPVCE